MKGRAIIPASEITDIRHKLKVINPDYTVISNININADKVYIVYPHYEDEARFIEAICRFTAFYGLDTFYYIDSTGDKWIVDNNGNMTACPELNINEENGDVMGHIPAMLYGWLVYKRYPELMKIRDVESGQKKIKDSGQQI